MSGNKHAEAFALMWYACQSCSHTERYWNSRDGVTPFCTVCPSCGEPTMQHVRWEHDTPAPDHKPHLGQRVWISTTEAAAKRYYQARLLQAAKEGAVLTLTASEISIRVNNMVARGEPDLIVWGYDERAPDAPPQIGGN